MSYRREINKIYKKLNSIAQKGQDGSFEFYVYIDDLVDGGQYQLLEDTMMTKYGVDIRLFKSTYDMKHKTYEIIRKKTVSVFQQQLKDLFNFRNVYQVGFHFYDSTNNHYLGDIREIEEKADWIAYKDPKLAEKQDQIRVINLEVTTGLEQSILDGIPPFVDNRTQTIYYESESLVRYEDNIYECILGYTYSNVNPITPTYSNYWMQIYSPNYSMTLIDNDEVKLIDKYSQAIDIVKSYIYYEPC
jgi:hypothetical protein